MKTLVLIRHAKSSWKHNVSDHERPLKSRGKTDAALVAKYIQKNALIAPDLILVSDANRAKLTAKIFIEQLHWQNIETYYNNDLYDFSGESVYNSITNVNEQINTLVIFGHNPAFTILATQLGSKYIGNLPTSGVVIIKFNTINWEAIKDGVTDITIYPKDLK